MAGAAAYLEVTGDSAAQGALETRELLRIWLEGVDGAVVGALPPDRPGREVRAAIRRVQVYSLEASHHAQQVLVGVVVEAGAGTPAP